MTDDELKAHFLHRDAIAGELLTRIEMVLMCTGASAEAKEAVLVQIRMTQDNIKVVMEQIK
jgi:hypothetical protein